MNLQTSISTCLKKYVTFSGRASRSEYWFFILFYFITSTSLEIIDTGVLHNPDVFSAVFAVIAFLPLLSVLCRRLHDLNLSGWWIAAYSGIYILILLIGILIAAKYPIFGITIMILAMIVEFGYAVWILCKSGTDGDNRFGSDPLASNSFQNSSNFSMNATKSATPFPQPNNTAPTWGQQSAAAPTSSNSLDTGCQKCGAALMKNMKYCPSCGAER